VRMVSVIATLCLGTLLGLTVFLVILTDTALTAVQRDVILLSTASILLFDVVERNWERA
jgi:hypothetical protein